MNNIQKTKKTSRIGPFGAGRILGTIRIVLGEQ